MATHKMASLNGQILHAKAEMTSVMKQHQSGLFVL